MHKPLQLQVPFCGKYDLLCYASLIPVPVSVFVHGSCYVDIFVFTAQVAGSINKTRIGVVGTSPYIKHVLKTEMMTNSQSLGPECKLCAVHRYFINILPIRLHDSRSCYSVLSLQPENNPGVWPVSVPDVACLPWTPFKDASHGLHKRQQIFAVPQESV